MVTENDALAGRYILRERISSGGMAAVWLAKDEVLARPIAVKILHPHLCADEAFLERFRREALAAARLAHPNIVAIYDTGMEDRPGETACHYIVMEHCGGGTLADHGSMGAFEPQRVAAVGITMCDALGYAHRNGVVHRDIKPANVLLTQDHTIKVADFGIAKAAFSTGNITTTGSILGTVTYVSPEQARGEEPDARSDLYSTGVLLYELATGRVPFEGETPIATAMQHVGDAPPPPRSIRPGIPRSLEKVILTALAKEPDERYESAEDMKAALEGAGDGSATAVVPPVVSRRHTEVSPPPTPATAGRGLDLRWIWGVIAVLAVVVLLAVLVPMLTDDSDPGPGRGNRQNGGGGDPGTIEIAAAEDFDPAAGDGEHPEDVGLAYDGDPETAWQSSTYNAPFEAIGKPGVGLLFDLGESVEVASVELDGSAGSVEVRVADERTEAIEGYEAAGTVDALEGTSSVEVDSATGRYWVIWITSLPGDSGGSASISEVSFIGP